LEYKHNKFLRIEKESETTTILREKFPLKYDKGLILKKLTSFKSASHGDVPFLAQSSNEEEGSDASPKSKDSFDDKEEGNPEKNERNFVHNNLFQ